MRIKNGKGTQFSSRALAGEVRDLALSHLKEILNPGYEDKDFQKDLLLRLAGSLLPKLNEVSGPEGKPIPILNLNEISGHNSDQEDSEAEEEN